jgi:hypothetical protein
MNALSFKWSVLLVACAASAAAQQQASHAAHGAAAAQLSTEEIATLARVQAAIVATRDSLNIQLAKSGNKTNKAQTELQDTLRTKIAAIMVKHGVSDAEYRRRTFLVSTDTTLRRLYDSAVVVVTGAPLAGQVARGPQLPVPSGPAGVHIGHVVNGFDDTPGLRGLLPVAIAETRIAAQHATLAGAQPTNLDYMKTHVGHVIHALDPTVLAAGPGLGYGVKKAAAGTAMHLEMATNAPGAPAAVVTHTKHIVTAARNTVARVDQMLALAQKVQSATTAAEAAALVSQISSLAEQLYAGADANSDGRISWEQGEGGLQIADEHVRLMLRP